MAGVARHGGSDMKSLYLLDEILSSSAPNWVPKHQLLDALGVSDHQLWILTKALSATHERPVQSNGRELRCSTVPELPLWLEELSGVARLSRATKRILVEDAIHLKKTLTITVKRAVLRILPFNLGDDHLIEAAEIPEDAPAKRHFPIHLEEIDAVVEIRKFSGDVSALRRFLGL
jgi:hypothetical protein